MAKEKANKPILNKVHQKIMIPKCQEAMKEAVFKK